MKSTEVIRVESLADMVRPYWHDDHFDKDTRTPTQHYEAIGYIVATFNGLEIYFRSLVGYIAGLKPRVGEALLTHVGSVTLGESLRSIASSITEDERVRDELIFCSKLFDRIRVNRNFVVHSTTYRPWIWVGDDSSILTKRTARGSLKTEHWSLPLQALRGVVEDQIAANQYYSECIGPLTHTALDAPLELPTRPALPLELAQSYPRRDLAELMRRPSFRQEDE